MTCSSEIMLVAKLPRPLCPSCKEEDGLWFLLPTLTVLGQLQQQELALQELLPLQHLGQYWTLLPSSFLAASHDVDVQREINDPRHVLSLRRE